MGRGARKKGSGIAQRLLGAEEERSRLRSILEREASPGVREDIEIELLALEFLRERPHFEKPTGLPQLEDPANFQRTSRVLQAVKGDPRFGPEMQVMVDLDSTLFSMDEAMREMGVDFPVSEIDGWEGNHQPLADAIMRDYWKRPDLQSATLSPEQKEEYYELVGEFFRRMHTDPEIMKRSGTFEYAPLAIQLLHRQGVRIHIFTHRNVESREATEEWLGAMGIPYDVIHVEDPVADPERSDKIAYCQREGIQFCIDDKPETIRRAEEAGIEAVSLHWDYARDTIRDSGADEGECWREVYSDLLGLMETRIIQKAEQEGWDIPLSEYSSSNG